MVSARLRAWSLAGGAMMLMAAGPGETDVEVEVNGTAGRYARPCGGHQDLASVGIRTALEAPLPGERDHAVVVEGWVESGPTRGIDEDGVAGDWSGAGAGSLAIGYSRRWGELTTGVVLFGEGLTLGDLSLQPLPTVGLRIGPEERIWWTAHLAPDLRSVVDYALRTDLNLALPYQLEASLGLTGAGQSLPAPVVGLEWSHPRGFGARVAASRTLDTDQWWWVQGALIFQGTVDRRP